MSVEVILFNRDTNSLFTHECEDISEAFEMLLTTIQIARSADPTLISISGMWKLRDQTLLNIARYLTDGKLSDEAREAFAALCDHGTRQTFVPSVQFAAAYAATDALDKAIREGADHWLDFDAKFEELKKVLAEN